MRHLGAESEIANIDMGGEDRVGSSDDRPLEGGAATANIDCGVRSNNAFRDPKRLEYLKDVVGKQGICLRQ